MRFFGGRKGKVALYNPKVGIIITNARAPIQLAVVGNFLEPLMLFSWANQARLTITGKEKRPPKKCISWD